MKNRPRKLWVLGGILVVLALGILATACSDSDSSPSAGGGAGSQSVVTLKGAAQ